MAASPSPRAALDEVVEGVRVVRAPEDPPLIPLDTANLLAWTMAFNQTLTRTALKAAGSGGYELIHAHDWLVTHSAVTLKDHLGVPLVATIHATEAVMLMTANVSPAQAPAPASARAAPFTALAAAAAKQPRSVRSW